MLNGLINSYNVARRHADRDVGWDGIAVNDGIAVDYVRYYIRAISPHSRPCRGGLRMAPGIQGRKSLRSLDMQGSPG